AGDDLEGHAGGDELLRLLAAAAEDEGIAALETDDALPFLRFVDEKLVDLVLRHRVRAGAFADVDDLRRLRGARHDLARPPRGRAPARARRPRSSSRAPRRTSAGLRARRARRRRWGGD